MEYSGTVQGEQEGRKAVGRRKAEPTSMCPRPVTDVSPASPHFSCSPSFPQTCQTQGLRAIACAIPLPVQFFAELAPSPHSSVCSNVTSPERPSLSTATERASPPSVCPHSASLIFIPQPVVRVHISLLTCAHWNVRSIRTWY